jgi:cyclin-dependent kinase regulatory subunit CKS1
MFKSFPSAVTTNWKSLSPQYSQKYFDDIYEYRHIIMPKALFKLIPKQFFEGDTGVLRLLSENEWRALGISQSPGWEHYEVHGEHQRI